MDNHTVEQRSKNMRAVKNKNTDLEMALRKELYRAGLRYRVHYKMLGKPDIVFPKLKIAVFCDGCFWHGCPKCSELPDQNQSFWLDKIKKNKQRDIFVTQELEKQGWKVLRYWGCEIKNDINEIINDIKYHVQQRKGNES
ncbi:MAG: very short patch repair endonuclease [Dethiobacteraceae bacterium]|jgi:DNA mismatch endonuclease (patch repair protein)